MASKLDDVIDYTKITMLFLSGLGILFGLVGAVIGPASVFFRDDVADNGFFQSIEGLGILIFLLGYLGLAICAFYFFDYRKSTTEFDELLTTKSRAKFVRSQSEMEGLALKLGSRKEKEYFQAKKRLKIK